LGISSSQLPTDFHSIIFQRVGQPPTRPLYHHSIPWNPIFSWLKPPTRWCPMTMISYDNPIFTTPMPIPLGGGILADMLVARHQLSWVNLQDPNGFFMFHGPIWFAIHVIFHSWWVIHSLHKLFFQWIKSMQIATKPGRGTTMT
jgi:hypothetical protein